MRGVFVISSVSVLALVFATGGCFDYLSSEEDFWQGTTKPSGECVPSSTSKAIDSSCGVFVSPDGSDATGNGTPENPYATITKALAAGQRIYACADPTRSYEEVVSIGDKEVMLFGALDCTTWAHAPSVRTVLTSPSGEIPLTMRAGGGARMEDFAITAKDALPLLPGELAPGRSAIAILAEASSSLDLVRCAVAAGTGGDGAPGEPPSGTGVPGLDGEGGADGCDSDQGEFGGDGGQSACDGVNVSGGSGGNGLKGSAGGDGGSGNPGGPTASGGLGQTVAIPCDVGSSPSSLNGVNGLPGEPAKGADSAALGVLSAGGFLGASGPDGMPGNSAQGAGGGGGAKGCANMMAGPGGGGGGAGGCGGAGGKGGYGAGSSIAIVNLGASMSFSEVLLTTSVGGAGGPGSQGQDGGKGGQGGAPGVGDGNAIACPGAKGGTGGKGGAGGGGRGGHSIGIAHWTNTVPNVTGATILVSVPGAGGTGEAPGGDGAAGLATQVQAF